MFDFAEISTFLFCYPKIQNEATALAAAALKGHEEVCTILLQAESDPNSCDRKVLMSEEFKL